MKYEVTHKTSFEYSSDVSISHHLLHLAPRLCPQQICRRHLLKVDPLPAGLRHTQDYFGNPTAHVTIDEPHSDLIVTATSEIEVVPQEPPLAALTAPWDTIWRRLQSSTDRDSLEVYQYAFDSPFTWSENAEAFARESFSPGRPVLEGALELMGRIYSEFTYEGGVTDIHTPVDQVLADRQGVCQDFAHVQIAALRAMGLPARYVSGYIRTYPPEGEDRLVGADASHAWVSVWVPDYGWVDLDPTNNQVPSYEHITVAWGRDYGDVSPINGMVVGGGAHEVGVSVDVAPLT